MLNQNKSSAVRKKFPMPTCNSFNDFINHVPIIGSKLFTNVQGHPNKLRNFFMSIPSSIFDSLNLIYSGIFTNQKIAFINVNQLTRRSLIILKLPNNSFQGFLVRRREKHHIICIIKMSDRKSL